MDNIFDLEEAAARETTAAPTYNNIAGLMPGYAWLEQLNPEQKQAVETTEGRCWFCPAPAPAKPKC